MSLAEFLSIVSLMVSAGAMFSVAYFAGVKLATLTVKVDTMWEFQLRRGKSEAVALGFASLNSPLVIFEETKLRMEIIMPKLRALFQKLSHKTTDVDLAIAIEKAYGNDMLKDVCIPCGMFLGACLVIAIQILRDEDEIENPNLAPPRQLLG